MTPHQLAAASADALRAGRRVSLTFPTGGEPKGFPRGELLNAWVRHGREERTCLFDGALVLAWLERHGLISRGEFHGN